MEKQARELIREELKKPEQQARWTGTGQAPSVVVEEVVRQMAPDLVARLFGDIAMRVVIEMRNQSNRW